MKGRKQTAAVLLAVLLALCLTACGGSSGGSDGVGSAQKQYACEGVCRPAGSGDQ